MQANKSLILLGLAGLSAALLGGKVLWRLHSGDAPQPVRTTARTVPTPSTLAPTTVPEPAAPAVSEPAPSDEVRPLAELAPAPAPAPAPAAARPKADLSALAPTPGLGARPPAPPDQDELARIALSFVGLDNAADIYWVGAINDPNLSEHERQNLIEDLNEDGISDPKHPAPYDLPLIVNRLRLIEELAPYAMDQVNLDSFKEAYQDLVNLADVATGQGQPVK